MGGHQALRQAAGGDASVGGRGAISPCLAREQVQGGKEGESSPPQSSHFLSSHLCYLPFMRWQSGFKGLGAAGTAV